MIDPTEDRTLWRALRSGDAAAARAFDQRHRDTLQRFCSGYVGNAADAEDITQETMRKALASDELPERPRVWLFAIARNLCLNLQRTRRRNPADPLPSDFDLAARMTGPLTAAARNDDAQALAALLAQLSVEERELLRLRYVDELERDEVATLVGLSVGVVKSRLHEALAKLRRNAPPRA